MGRAAKELLCCTIVLLMGAMLGCSAAARIYKYRPWVFCAVMHHNEMGISHHER